MARGFSQEDLAIIKNNLQVACEQSWKNYGYKGTRVPALTKEVGISTGAFYLVYDTKEALFIDVLKQVQAKLLLTWATAIETNSSPLAGFKEGLTWLFHEYQRYPLLYDFNNSEYDLFLAKLPQTQVDELKENSTQIFSEVLTHSKLQLKLPEEETMNIIHSILFLALIDRDTLQGTEKTFHFLVDQSLPNLFEEESHA